MSKVSVSQLSGPALDWAVAKCENLLGDHVRPDRKGILRDETCRVDPYTDEFPEYSPSSDWSQGGPIIENAKISVWFEPPDWALNDTGVQWQALIFKAFCTGPAERKCITYRGPSALVAATRCYVASKLGDEIEVPNELII